MKIDLVSPFYRPVTGGIEDHVAALAQAARGAGHEVTVHAIDRDLQGRSLPAEELLDGVRVHRWPARIKVGYYTTRFEPQLEGDVAHLHGYGLWTHDWVARHHAARPLILTLHHGLRIPTSTPLHALYHWYHRRTKGQRTLLQMRRVVAVTPVDVERLETLGFDMERVELIPNGVPEAAFAPTEPKPPPAGWDSYVLYVGRVHREKRVGDAVRAVAGLPEKVGLVVAGPDHGDRVRVERLASREGLAGRVRFLGRVSEDRKRALLAGARVFVLPSEYEAQGRVILEAWAQGTPVVASRVGGVPHLVEDGRDGLLYACGDVDALRKRIRELLEDDALAGTLAAAGRDKARTEYREEDLLARTVALYDEVVAEGPVSQVQ